MKILFFTYISCLILLNTSFAFGSGKALEDARSSSSLLNGNLNPTLLSSQDAVRFSLETLSPRVMIQITDYLNYQDQFNLALTSHRQWFLWGSIGRVPEPATTPLVISTPDVTYLRWDEGNWPREVNQTVIIEIDKDIIYPISAEELNDQLGNILNLFQVVHLHFQAAEHKNILIDITPLIVKSDQTNNLSRRLFSLRSLVFRGVCTENSGYASPSKIRNFVIQGRAIRVEDWRRRLPKWEKPFYMEQLLRYKARLKNFHFSRAQLERGTLPSILHDLQRYPGSRLVEIQENSLDLEGNQVQFTEPWYEGIDFILRPWVLEENGNVRVRCERKHYVPGPSKVRCLTVKMPQEALQVPWYRLFTFLSPTYLSITELLPLFRAWATEDRLEALTKLLPESQIESQDDRKVFILPQNLQEPFHTFWYGPEEASFLTQFCDSDKEKKSQSERITQTNFLTLPQGQEILADPIRVAASRHSQEVLTVPMRILIEVIRENAQGQSAVQSLIDQLPSFSTAPQDMISRLKEVLEFFIGDSTYETEEPNNAEVLVGTQLMAILRSLAAAK